MVPDHNSCVYGSGSQTFKFQGLHINLAVYKWNQMGPQSYRFGRVNIDPPKGTQRVPEMHLRTTEAMSLKI